MSLLADDEKRYVKLGVLGLIFKKVYDDWNYEQKKEREEERGLFS